MSTFNLSILGLQTGRSFNNATAITNQALRRLSTGLRINRGADDPAGLISSERLKA
ncbi:MAG: flagellin, partial [Planctomycetota bacterium]